VLLLPTKVLLLPTKGMKVQAIQCSSSRRAHELNVKYLMGDPDKPHILVEAFAPMRINQKSIRRLLADYLKRRGLRS
jgi:hypothetical protein